MVSLLTLLSSNFRIKMPKRFPPLPSLRDILKMYQITAKKNLSQNFILDPSVLRRFVKSAGIYSSWFLSFQKDMITSILLSYKILQRYKISKIYKKILHNYR